MQKKIKILVTGSTGFVGKNVVARLQKEKTLDVVSHFHSQKSKINDGGENSFGLSIGSDTNWVPYLNDVDTIVHTAAVAQVKKADDQLNLADIKTINTEGVLNLAKQAVLTKVKRFVFISSIKVNGEITERSHSFSEGTRAFPVDAYAVSKYEAEKGLLEIAKNSDMEVVIIRPPLVYGSGVKANFASLIRLVKKGIPLPLGTINNKRSLIAIDNLVDFIALCADRERSPEAANQVFVVSDDEDVSTTELLKKIAKAYDKKQWLIPVPVGLMKFVAKLLGKSEQADRVFGNLQVDCSKAKTLLDWKPVITMDEQLKKMADAER
jgi:nucleoside-diphosphate-sugar epimerase